MKDLNKLIYSLLFFTVLGLAKEYSFSNHNSNGHSRPTVENLGYKQSIPSTIKHNFGLDYGLTADAGAGY